MSYYCRCKISFAKETNKPLYRCIYSLFEPVCVCTCVHGSQYLKRVKASNFFFFFSRLQTTKTSEASNRPPVQCSYLEVDLLGQFLGLVVLGAGVAVGGQRQEGGAHGAAASLAAEVLGPAGEEGGGRMVRLYLPTERLAFPITFRQTIGLLCERGQSTPPPPKKNSS